MYFLVQMYSKSELKACFKGDSVLSVTRGVLQFHCYTFSFQHNDEECCVCGLKGTIIMCDYCPRSYHYMHCTPPLSKDNLPNGLYTCVHCRQLPDHLRDAPIEFVRVITGQEKEAQVVNHQWAAVETHMLRSLILSMTARFMSDGRTAFCKIE